MITYIFKVLYKFNQFKKLKNWTPYKDLNIPELSFTVVITSYNNEKYCKKNLESVLIQNYNNFNIIYIDDASTDNTEGLVKSYLKKHDTSKKCTYIRNKKRQLKLKNIYELIHSLPDQQVVIELDGDDYLSHSNVLHIINYHYYQTSALFIHTNYQNNPDDIAKKLKLETFSHETPWIVKKYRSFRKYPWIYSGIRSYYAWLFKKIKKEDLICIVKPYKNRFFPVSHDLAVTYPILEMASPHIEYISKRLLIRNIDSNINDFKKFGDTIRNNINTYILSKKKYEKHF